MNIRVLLVDDHPVVRFGLRSLLDAEDDLEVVGEASDGREAVDLCRVLHPDVVLMDLRMPGGDGTTATARLAEEMPDVRVLVLTTFDGDGDILRAVEVLRAVARGRTNAQIGRELSIGEATVKTHLLRTFAKLGVDDRTHAVTVAMHRGLLDNDGASG
jgi:DNA-binding NarL/FixJ family response regulator